MTAYSIAIVGATGLVGRAFLQIMEEQQIAVGELRLFASERSKGQSMTYRGQDYPLDVIRPGSFEGVDYALFSAGASLSKTHAKQAVQEGAIVIDNSSAWRMDPMVPLVVPEINLSDAIHARLIANPNCSTIQAVLPLAVLDQLYHVKQVEYNTYQAVSGAGQKGLDDLITTQKGQPHTHFPVDISKTVIPQIDVFLEDDYTKEERKMIEETRKILHRPDLPISATCVRVPVAHSHAVSIRVTLERPFDVSEIRNVFSQSPGIVLKDNPTNLEYPTSLDATGSNDVFVGRLRRDTIDPLALLLFVVADNIRKGAAWNAVQIMMELMSHE